jgi:hypothetical protein
MAAVATKVAAGMRRLLGRLAAAVRAAALWVARALEAFGSDGSPSVVSNDECESEEDQDESGEMKTSGEVPTKERKERTQAACISRACAFAKRASVRLMEVRDKTKTRLRNRMSERRARKHQRTREQAA